MTGSRIRYIRRASRVDIFPKIPLDNSPENRTIDASPRLQVNCPLRRHDTIILEACSGDSVAESMMGATTHAPRLPAQQGKRSVSFGDSQWKSTRKGY